jgi:hypothetical protein
VRRARRVYVVTTTRPRGRARTATVLAGLGWALMWVLVALAVLAGALAALIAAAAGIPTPEFLAARVSDRTRARLGPWPGHTPPTTADTDPGTDPDTGPGGGADTGPDGGTGWDGHGRRT